MNLPVQCQGAMRNSAVIGTVLQEQGASPSAISRIDLDWICIDLWDRPVWDYLDRMRVLKRRCRNGDTDACAIVGLCAV